MDPCNGQRISVDIINMLMKASPHIPKAEIAYFRELPKVTGPPQEFYNDDNIVRLCVAYNRVTNPICSGCGIKPPNIEKHLLVPCPRCGTVFYCSFKCRCKDMMGQGLSAFEGGTKGHKMSCANQDAPRDVGPHTTTVVRVDW